MPVSNLVRRPRNWYTRLYVNRRHVHRTRPHRTGDITSIRTPIAIDPFFTIINQSLYIHSNITLIKLVRQSSLPSVASSNTAMMGSYHHISNILPIPIITNTLVIIPLTGYDMGPVQGMCTLTICEYSLTTFLTNNSQTVHNRIVLIDRYPSSNIATTHKT